MTSASAYASIAASSRPMFQSVVPWLLRIVARVRRLPELSPPAAPAPGTHIASACSHSRSDSSLLPTSRAIAERRRSASASASLSPASRAYCIAGATARDAAGALPTSM